MNNGNNVIDFPDADDDIEELPPHQEEFDNLLGMYSTGLEPLENWNIEHLKRLQRTIDAELQRRYNDQTLPEYYSYDAE